MKKYVWLFLLVSWMMVIFSFSAKNRNESSESSHRVSMWIGQMVIADFDEWTLEKQLAFAEKIEYPVRKGAHASEYAILGIFSLITLFEWRDTFQNFLYNKHKKQLNWKKIVLLSWVMATLYACSDEFHQLFVPGRSGQIKDVCIDSAGAIVGIIGIRILFILWNLIQKNKGE